MNSSRVTSESGVGGRGRPGSASGPRLAPPRGPTDPAGGVTFIDEGAQVSDHLNDILRDFDGGFGDASLPGRGPTRTETLAQDLAQQKKAREKRAADLAARHHDVTAAQALADRVEQQLQEADDQLDRAQRVVEARERELAARQQGKKPPQGAGAPSRAPVAPSLSPGAQHHATPVIARPAPPVDASPAPAQTGGFVLEHGGGRDGPDASGARGAIARLRDKMR